MVTDHEHKQILYGLLFMDQQSYIYDDGVKILIISGNFNMGKTVNLLFFKHFSRKYNNDINKNNSAQHIYNSK